MTCSNCDHPHSDHVVMVTNEGVTTSCFYPVHRNYDCPCTNFQRNDDLREAPHP
jgi:hypothetical protein